MYFDKIYLSTEFWLEWLLLLFKLFINNDIRASGLSQYVALSVTDVDVDFTEAVLMLILYQQYSPIDLLVLIIVDHIDTGWTYPLCQRIVIIQMTIEMKSAYWIKDLLFIFEKEAF